MLRPKAIEKESLRKERSRKRDSPVPGLARCELAAKRAWYTFWGLFSDYGSGNGSGSSATRRDGTPAHIRPQAGSAWTQCVSSYRLNSQNLNGVLKIQVCGLVSIAASTVNLQTNEPVASGQTAKREDVIRDRTMRAALRNTEYALRRWTGPPNDWSMKNHR
jgi:hypothetical protein